MTDIFLDLGLQPISNRFLTSPRDSSPLFPLALTISKKTGDIKIKQPFPVSELRPRYSWLTTCFEPEDHLDDFVDELIDLTGISSNSRIGAFSFKDDSTLRRLEKKGFKNTWRLDPQRDLGIEDDVCSIETLQDRFNSEKAKNVHHDYGETDVLVVRHVLEHSYNMEDFIEGAKRLVKPNGYVIWELPDSEKALSISDYSMIWEEHVHYFTQFTFKNLIESRGFEILFCETIDYPFENSIIAVTKISNENIKPIIIDTNQVSIELNRAVNFSNSLFSQKMDTQTKIKSIKDEYGPIALYGAGHLAIAFLSIMDVSHMIEFAIDDNENKIGMWMPIGNLEIKDSSELDVNNIGVCLLGLNPQNQPQVLNKHSRYTTNGGMFASIFPGSENYFGRLL